MGGEFFTSPGDLQGKIQGIKAFIFDWDGVFNDGVKADTGGSPFSEVDSMGLNMLRFSYFLEYGFIPEIFLVTGENNPSALHLAEREHFRAVYLNAKVKTEALAHMLKYVETDSSQMAFMFDDILDLGLAATTGAGFFVRRDANPLLNDYVKRNNLADYQTASVGGQNPVREVCELCMAALDNFNEVVALRVSNDPKYQEYLGERNQLATTFYRYNSGAFSEFE